MGLLDFIKEGLKFGVNVASAGGFRGYLDAQAANMGVKLSGAQTEQNEYNAYQAQLNRDYQTQMSNTANQRAVADMQAAGLNPALMYGSGSSASTPSGAVASGVASGPRLSPFEAALQLKNLELTDAQIGNIKADTDKKVAETSETYQNIDLSKATVEKVQAEIDKIIAETQTESTKQLLNTVSARLNDVTADNIIALQDSMIALNEAKSEEASAAAAHQFASALYQQGLIDSGYIEAMRNESIARARDLLSGAELKESERSLNEYYDDVKRGNVFNPDEQSSKIGKATAKCLNSFIGSLNLVKTTLGGFSK